MKTKSIDAVKLMRGIRDELSHKMAHMTSVERVKYIRELAAASELGKSLQQARESAERQ